MTKRNDGTDLKHLRTRLSGFAVLGIGTALFPYQARAETPAAPMEEVRIYCRTFPSRAERLVTESIRYRYRAGELGRVLSEFEAKFEQLVGRDSECEWVSVQSGKPYKDWDTPGATLEVGSRDAPFSQKVSLIDLPKNWYPGDKPATTQAQQKSGGKADTKASPATADKNQTAEKEPTAAELAAKRRAEVAQRNREKQAKYDADKKAWQDQIDTQKAEEERKKAKLETDKQLAAQKLSAFEAEQAAHRLEMEKHAQLLLEHQTAQQRHALCSAGDRAACEALAQGKMAEANLPQKDPGEASTDTDARRCVAEPVLSPNEAFKGSLKAVVTNGCDKPVDVRICLMRTGGWNCGMTLGLKPQDNWTWWTMNPQDGVFWDARTSGSNRKLGHPSGA